MSISLLKNDKENLNLEENVEQGDLEKEQNSFLKTNIGQAINGAINLGLKIVLPDCVEDEVIEVKDALITEGFSAAVDTAIEEATNLGKSALGILTGTFENVSQVGQALKSGGLVDTISGLLDSAISWGKNKGYISKNIAKTIKSGKNTVIKSIKSGIDNTLENQSKAIDKIDGYISKWQEYYEKQDLQNMEYQYNKIKEKIEDVLPLEQTLKKARTIEILHELIKNKDKESRFSLSEQEEELASILAN